MAKRTPAKPPSPPRHPGATLGLLEWFRPGEHDRVDRVLAEMATLGVRHLRTGISWADWQTPEGEAWYAWLFPQLSRGVDVLPCFVHTPPSWGVAPKRSAPPARPRSYADFVDTMIRRFGQHFTHVELWNEPNDPRAWDAALDPDWFQFADMVGAAANWAKQCGKTTVLGGMSPVDPAWLRLMGERSLLQYIDVVGIHAFPAVGDAGWHGWAPLVGRVREVLAQYRPDAAVWITGTGYSTWRHDDRRQLTALVDALDAPVDRVYWYSTTDLDPGLPTGEGFHADERDYHYGLRRADGGPQAPGPPVGRGRHRRRPRRLLARQGRRPQRGLPGRPRQARPHHRRVRVHRHQPGRPPHGRRAGRADLRQPVPPRRRAQPGPPQADPRRRHAGRGRRRPRRPRPPPGRRRRQRRLPLRRPGRRHHQPDPRRPRLRRQRPRHPQPARGHPLPGRPPAPGLHQHQQGLRRPDRRRHAAERPAVRARGRPRPPPRHRRGPPPRLPQPLRLQQGRRRPVRRRLREDVPACPPSPSA